MKIILPSTLTKKHQDALQKYLRGNPQYGTSIWETVYEAIDILSQTQVITEQTTRTFRQIYTEYVERPFAEPYIEQLLASDNVTKENLHIAAVFARKIIPSLQQANLLGKAWPQSLLLSTYCVYWWQSFCKGYAFEVEIMHDLSASDIDFHMHDVRNRVERLSPADLTVLGLWGDIKTSIYFLRQQSNKELRSDFYITRLYEKGHERTLVVFRSHWPGIQSVGKRPFLAK